MSIAGGADRAVDRAVSVAADALQIFVKSARQWVAAPPDPEVVARYRDRAAETGLAPHTLAHASYLINLAASDPALRRRSIAALEDELDRCALFGVPYLVLHPGSHVGDGESVGIARIAAGIERAMARRRGGGKGAAPRDPVTLLLENTAGQGSNLGSRFEELAAILDRCDGRARLGVCFDTCHALAAGYDLRDEAGYRRTFRQFESCIGLDRLRAFHLNDSRGALGSRVDRHEHIGEGQIGLEGFRLLLRDRRFHGLPMVLETPKGEDDEGDRRNLTRLRQLRDAAEPIAS